MSRLSVFGLLTLALVFAPDRCSAKPPDLPSNPLVQCTSEMPVIATQPILLSIHPIQAFLPDEDLCWFDESEEQEVQPACHETEEVPTATVPECPQSCPAACTRYSRPVADRFVHRHTEANSHIPTLQENLRSLKDAYAKIRQARQCVRAGQADCAMQCLNEARSICAAPHVQAHIESVVAELVGAAQARAVAIVGKEHKPSGCPFGCIAMHQFGMCGMDTILTYVAQVAAEHKKATAGHVRNCRTPVAVCIKPRGCGRTVCVSPCTPSCQPACSNPCTKPRAEACVSPCTPSCKPVCSTPCTSPCSKPCVGPCTPPCSEVCGSACSKPCCKPAVSCVPVPAACGYSCGSRINGCPGICAGNVCGKGVNSECCVTGTIVEQPCATTTVIVENKSKACCGADCRCKTCQCKAPGACVTTLSLEEKLKTPVTVYFVGTPLQTVFDMLRASYALPLVVENGALAERGVPSSLPITMHAQQVPLKLVLDLLTRPMGLEVAVSSDVVRIISNRQPCGVACCHESCDDTEDAVCGETEDAVCSEVDEETCYADVLEEVAACRRCEELHQARAAGVKEQVDCLLKACYLAIADRRFGKAADLARQAHALDADRIEGDPILYKMHLLANGTGYPCYTADGCEVPDADDVKDYPFPPIETATPALPYPLKNVRGQLTIGVGTNGVRIEIAVQDGKAVKEGSCCPLEKVGHKMWQSLFGECNIVPCSAKQK